MKKLLKLKYAREIQVSESALDIAKRHLIVWPQSVDSQLWNDRVNALLFQLEELERQINESKTIKG